MTPEEGPKSDSPAEQNLELPPAVIAQAEAAAVNSTEGDESAPLDLNASEDSFRATNTLTDQKYELS